MIGVYNQVWLAPYNVEQITQLQIKRTMKEHDTAYIKGIMSATSIAAYQNMIDGKTIVSLYFKEQENTQLLFAGFIKSLHVVEIGNQREAQIELLGLTQALDRTKATLDYQDVSKKNTDIIDVLMKSYPDISYTVSCKQESIETLLLQYEETDYEFFKRLLSRIEEPMYTTMQGKHGMINCGVSVRESGAVLDDAEWEISYQQGMTYCVETEEYLDLGMEVMLDGKKLIVTECNHQYQNGESRNIYVLGTKELCKTTKISNHQITGISLDGVIKECKRDRVKIELNKTMPCEDEQRRWFSYSSPAASTDGSGWYCMPQIGEEARLFCPTEEENDAYVISAIRKKDNSDTQKQQVGSNPSNKVLANADGQTVSFQETGIEMACKNGATMLSVNQDGTIEITANKDIHVYAEQAVILRAEQGMCATSVNAMTLKNDTGSTILIQSEITEMANRIKNNC